MTWLITGGSGYIGKHIVQEMLDKGLRVTVYDLRLHEPLSTNSTNLNFVEGDIRDFSKLKSLLHEKSFEGIINLAGLKSVNESLINPELYNSVNNLAATNLMNLAVEHQVPNFIQASTAAIYGSSFTGVVSESMKALPISPYGLSKFEAEKYLTTLINLKKINGASLRYFNVAGSVKPDFKDTGKANIFPIFIDQLRKGESPSIFGHDLGTVDGTCIRDYIHVVDLAKAHIHLLENLSSSTIAPVINFGSGIGTSVLQVFTEISEKIGSKIPPALLPPRKGDPICLIADTSILEKDLRFESTKTLGDMVLSSL